MDRERTVRMPLAAYVRKNLRHLVLAASTLTAIQKGMEQDSKVLNLRDLMASDGGMTLTLETLAAIQLSLAAETIRQLLEDVGIEREEVMEVINSANMEIDMIAKLGSD